MRRIFTIKNLSTNTNRQSEVLDLKSNEMIHKCDISFTREEDSDVVQYTANDGSIIYARVVEYPEEGNTFTGKILNSNNLFGIDSVYTTLLKSSFKRIYDEEPILINVYMFENEHGLRYESINAVNTDKLISVGTGYMDGNTFIRTNETINKVEEIEVEEKVKEVEETKTKLEALPKTSDGIREYLVDNFSKYIVLISLNKDKQEKLVIFKRGKESEKAKNLEEVNIFIIPIPSISLNLKQLNTIKDFTVFNEIEDNRDITLEEYFSM